MLKLESIRIRNLRSLEDTHDIALKPLTILVGRNSSGKSTFARVFPLLRQSAEATKRGPILWWGRLVDFGSYNESLNRNSALKEMRFDFRISFTEGDFRYAKRREFGRLSMARLLGTDVIHVSISIKAGISSTFTSSITLSIFDFKAVISLSESGFVEAIECGSYVWRPTTTLVCYAPQDQLLPAITFFKKPDNDIQAPWEVAEPIANELTKALRVFVHGNTTEQKIRQLAYRIPIGKKAVMFEQLCKYDPPSFRESLKNWGVNSSIFNSLCEISFASQIESLLGQLSNSLNSSFWNDVVYLEPLRATAQRYYRQQSLAVGEIDSKGENIAMFLDSLEPSRAKDFREWTAAHFGIEVIPKKEGGHLSLTIKHMDSQVASNIADMGFGFSQMLPIAAQLWAGSRQANGIARARQFASAPIIVIEQPELHLHPDYQAKISDLFVASLQNGTRIIAETHSPALVNRLGHLIATGQLDRNAVQVILFEQEDARSHSVIRISEFDEEGVLKNWPMGFFEPTYSN